MSRQETEKVIEKYGVLQPFKELLERNAAGIQNINQSISINIGNKCNSGFLSCLRSSFENPLVHIQFYDDEPQLRISSFDRKNGGGVVLNLDFMNDVEIKENRVGDDFLNYDISFHYSPANMDYRMKVVVK